MARLKFLVFALLVIAVWAAHLVLLTPPVVARSVDLAMAQAQAARPLAEARVNDRRQLLQRTALKLSAQPRMAAMAQALRPASPRDAVSAERLQPLREMVQEQAPEPLRATLVFGFTTDGGGTFFQGAEPAEGLDVALGKAGADGMVQEAFGVSHLFVSLPVWDRSAPGEPKQVGAIVLGTPLLTGEMMDAVAKDAALAAAGVFQGGRLVQGGGAEKAALERVAKLAQPGTGTVVDRGATASLGPLKLPLFTAADDRTGGRAPLLVASRQAIEDTPYEFIAITSVQPLMAALGGYQLLAVGVFAGLLVLTLVWAAMMRSGGEAGAAEEGEEAEAQESTQQEPEPAPAPAAAAPEPSSSASAAQAQLATTMPDPSAQEPGDPRLARAIAALSGSREEDFPAPSMPFEPSPEPATTAERDPLPSSAEPPDPFAQYAPPPVPDAEGTGRISYPFESPGQDQLPPVEPEPTPLPQFRAYPPPAEASPYFSSDPSIPPVSPDDNPDATRVAMVPQELLKASARDSRTGMAAARPSAAPAPPPKMPSVAAAGPSGGSEEAHFQEIYREFVSTRERCGEGADGLTYDKFAAKLRKNKEQLVQKYACKTVRSRST